MTDIPVRKGKLPFDFTLDGAEEAAITELLKLGSKLLTVVGFSEGSTDGISSLEITEGTADG